MFENMGEYFYKFIVCNVKKYPVKNDGLFLKLARPAGLLRHLVKSAFADRHTFVCLFTAVRTAFSQVQIPWACNVKNTPSKMTGYF